MQKVVGSSPISRFEKPANAGFFRSGFEPQPGNAPRGMHRIALPPRAAGARASHSIRRVGPPDETAIAVRWLRVSYRTGAVVDGLAAIGMIFPARLWTARFRRGFKRSGPELAYGMRAGAALMAGWTVLLLWADRRPLERKAVLPMTMLPVIAGLMANDAAAVRSGDVTRASVAPTRLLQFGLLGLFGLSYLKATRVSPAGALS
jgi:hypothetical protein